MVGINFSWTAPTFVKFKDTEHFTVTNGDLSWIASSFEAGRFFGCLLGAIMVDKVGRKCILTVVSFSFFILWLIMVFASSIKLICCLRMLLGTTQGINMVVTFTYTAENCPPRMIGIMSGIILLSTKMAKSIETALVTYSSFTVAAAVNAAVGFCGFSASLFLKETPYFMLMKGCNDVAKNNLMWLRGKSTFDSEIKLELDKISENLQLETAKNKSGISVLAVPENYKSMWIIAILFFLSAMTGHYSILAYSSIIFQSSSMFSSNEFAIIAHIFTFVITFILPFVRETCSRKKLLFSLSFSLVIIHVCTIFIFSAKVYISEKFYSWLIFFLVTSSITANHVILTMTAIFSSELLPMNVKVIGNYLIGPTNSLAAFLTVAIFLPIVGAYGIEYNFLLYSIAGALFCVFIHKILPETGDESFVDEPKSRKAKEDKSS